MTLNKKILLGFAACTVVLISVALFSFKNNEKFIDSSLWVDHTHRVMYEFEQVLGYSVDAETGARGFIITGDEKFLKPYEEANKKLFEHVDKVKDFTSDNLAQQKNIDHLRSEIKTHLTFLNTVIAARKTDTNKAYQMISSGEGKRIQDRIRKMVGDARGIEEKLLEERKQASETDARNFNIVFIILIFIIVLVLIAVYIIIYLNLRALKRAETETSNKNWLLTGNDELNARTQGEKEVPVLAADMISLIASYLKAQIGAIYLLDNDQLNLTGGYAFDYTGKAGTTKIGEGIVGQAAFEKKPIQLNDLPPDYIKINSGLGKTLPKNLIAYPFTYSGRVKGVIEIASMNPFSELDLQFLNLVSENIGIAFNSSESRTRLVELLEETQMQSEELQSQQEELKQLNEELEERAQNLKQQQEELKQLNEELEEQAQNLKQQQEELQQTNEELEQQTQALEQKNKEVEKARYDIENQARQIELSSKYKSEFLANMSHELRTPLNSLLILSRDLSENKTKNLTEEQVESAEIIYKGGNDLLVLINEVLDLSKIEAGKMSLNIEKMNIKHFSDIIYKTFKRHIEQKGLSFQLHVSDKLPVHISTDLQRLDQILKNLISNAIKFTDKGSISLTFELKERDKLSISVADTGVGIPQDKQNIIFEAFQQAEGGTSRKYGGTGLGLSISRELAKLLGGEIILQSKLNEGSVFILTIPLELKDSELYEPRKIREEKSPVKNEIKKADNLNAVLSPSLIDDDRDNIDEKDKVILIIDDDLKFAEILKKQAKQKGFKSLVTDNGEEGLTLAKKYIPQAIILDLVLPGISGHNVLTELKSEKVTRHIPVHIVSVEERSLDLIKEGAIEFLTKPVYKEQLDEAFSRIERFMSRKVKNLLIIEDDDNSRKAIKKLIGNGDVKCLEAATGTDALHIIENETIDCIILDLGLPDISGFEVIKEIENKGIKNIPPIIVYTGKELSKEENYELQKYAESIIIKGVKSEERLLDETALFLHRTINNLPEFKQEIISGLYDKEKIFQSKKILLVDDDMRNLFALSKILKEKSMEVIKAENGLIALQLLEKNPDTDMVLMDIMMPEMDGYEAMRKIRLQEKYEELPIIALTAKAMKDDKQKCLDAGANEYISKPIDVQRLLSLMRVWLSK